VEKLSIDEYALRDLRDPILNSEAVRPDSPLGFTQLSPVVELRCHYHVTLK
jgi:hypothetical protein